MSQEVDFRFILQGLEFICLWQKASYNARVLHSPYSCRCHLLFMQHCACWALGTFMKTKALPQNPHHWLDHRINKHVLLVSQLPACTCKASPCVLRQTKPGIASAWMVASSGAADHSSDMLKLVPSSCSLPKLLSCLFHDLLSLYDHQWMKGKYAGAPELYPNPSLLPCNAMTILTLH